MILARISPDGRYLAYATLKRGQFSMWVRQMATPSAVQILAPTTSAIGDFTFTPDGNFIDYSLFSISDSTGKIYQIPVLGGTPRQILDSVHSLIAYSPDGSQIAYSQDVPQQSQTSLMVANADGSNPKPLATRRVMVQGGNFNTIHWAPDGRHIVATIVDNTDPNGQRGALIEVDTKSGEQRPFPGRKWRDLHDFAWLPDGTGIVVDAMEKSAGVGQLYIVAYPSGDVHRISNDLDDYLSVGISTDGRSIIAGKRTLSSEVFSGSLSAPDNLQQITSGRLDGLGDLVIFPDGRLVYSGNHAGNWDIFIADANGENSRQLTFDNRFHANLAACDDNRSVLYASNFSGVDHIYRFDLQTANSSQITNGTGELFPVCTGSGSTVYYSAFDNSNSQYIFKTSYTGGGNPTRLSDLLAVSPPFLSLDGKHLAFGTPQKDGRVVIVVVNSETGAKQNEVEIPATFDQTSHAATWLPDNRTMALSDVRTGTSNLWSFPMLSPGPAKQLTHFTAGSLWSVAVSRDSKTLALSRGDNKSDVVLFTASK